LLMACGRHTKRHDCVNGRRMALCKGRSSASKGMCVVYFLQLRAGIVYIGASALNESRRRVVDLNISQEKSVWRVLTP